MRFSLKFLDKNILVEENENKEKCILKNHLNIVSRLDWDWNQEILVLVLKIGKGFSSDLNLWICQEFVFHQNLKEGGLAFAKDEQQIAFISGFSYLVIKVI